MSDEHIARILKMLEEGKISASEAEALLAAIRAGTQPPPPPPPRAPSGPSRSGQAQEEQETSGAKSFEFRWSQRRTFPIDLSTIGKQITDAVKKIDPDRLLREARIGSKRWQERLRHWTREWDSEESAPQNTLGLPAKTDVESRTFDLPDDTLVQIENNAGGITVTPGPVFAMEVHKEAWGATEEEAAARLREIAVDVVTFARQEAPQTAEATPPARLEVRVTTPEGWRHGTAAIQLQVPSKAQIRLATVFGPINVRDLAGKVDAHTITGEVDFENLQGDARAEAVSGDLRARHMGGSVLLNAKSGDVTAEHLSRGATVNSVSGDVRVAHGEGGRVEAKSVSGDVTVEQIGCTAPVDLVVESVSGDVHIDSVAGNITLKTVSGDSSARHIATSTLQCKAVSGDVVLQLDNLFSGTLSCTTVSGDVRVAVPAGSNYRYTLDTQSGEIHCQVEAQETARTESLRSGIVGTGAGTLSVQTLSGNIELTPRDET